MTTLRARSKSSTKSPEMLPTEKDLVAFGHAAAGHEGISSNASGSLVVKPCTQAEIDFYESAKDHPFFQAHMPTFMGTLTLNKQQNVGAAPEISAASGFAIPLNAAASLKSAVINVARHVRNISIPDQAAQLHSPLTPNISSKRASWQPSGGKKLETGLAVVLENMAAGYKRPNILDVKLGSRLWADDAHVAKRKKLDDVSRNTTSGALGFRIAGMKVWQSATNSSKPVAAVAAANGHSEFHPHIEEKDGFMCYNKHYGQGLTTENVEQGFIEYLGAPRRRSKLLAERFIRELEHIEYALEQEESRMYSASVLIVYEGDEDALEAALQEEEIMETAAAENKARGRKYNADGSVKTQDEIRENGEIRDGEAEEGDDNGEGDDDDDSSEDSSEGFPKIEDVCLIDFAHASWTPGQGPDNNSLQGIRNMIKVLKDVVATLDN